MQWAKLFYRFRQCIATQICLARGLMQEFQRIIPFASSQLAVLSCERAEELGGHPKHAKESQVRRTSLFSHDRNCISQPKIGLSLFFLIPREGSTQVYACSFDECIEASTEQKDSKSLLCYL